MDTNEVCKLNVLHQLFGDRKINKGLTGLTHARTHTHTHTRTHAHTHTHAHRTMLACTYNISRKAYVMNFLKKYVYVRYICTLTL